jgi:hypothetical protein
VNKGLVFISFFINLSKFIYLYSGSKFLFGRLERKILFRLYHSGETCARNVRIVALMDGNRFSVSSVLAIIVGGIHILSSRILFYIIVLTSVIANVSFRFHLLTR